MCKIVIRKTRLNDAANLRLAFREITIEASKWILIETNEVPKTVAGERKFIKGLLKSKNSIHILAECCGEIAGMLGAHGGALKRVKHVATIGIAVRKKFQRRGIAEAMFKYLFQWARKASVTRLVLEVDPGNTAALNLYRKMGFIKDGYFKNASKIGNRYRDHIHMAKILM